MRPFLGPYTFDGHRLKIITSGFAKKIDTIKQSHYGLVIFLTVH